MKRVTVINGPNLNLLGAREPAVYGAATLDMIAAQITRHAAGRATIAFTQSNHEGEIVDLVQQLPATADGAIVNLGGYTHTSIAIRDAFLAVQVPFVEVHLSNLFKREAVRHHSVTADLAVGLISGFGARGYLLALDALLDILSPGAPS